MFEKVGDAQFITGEHEVLKFWEDQDIFAKLRQKNAEGPRWSFLDGPITANNPMGVHHAWGRTYKDMYQRFFAMMGFDQRYQNGFDCQGLWVEVEVEKQLGLKTKHAVGEYGIDNFVNECKRRVLRFAARQTEQSIRLGYWMDWDDPDQLRALAEKLGTGDDVNFTAPSGRRETGRADQLVERLGCPEWGGSYFTFSTENNETIWTFLKKCFTRKKIYQGHDVMPWSGRGGSAYSQMEIAEGRKLTTHKSVFVRFPLRVGSGTQESDPESIEYLLVWTTTPWTLTSNVAAAVNSDLDYVKIKAKRDNAVYYFAKDNLHHKRLETEFKEGFGRPDWKWPQGVPKLKTLSQIFKENGGYKELGIIKGSEMVGWQYWGPFDGLPAQSNPEGDDLTIRGESGRKAASDALDKMREELTSPEMLAKLFADPHGAGTQHLLEEVTSKVTGSIMDAVTKGRILHHVIDGGRDSRGNPHVVAGEGTGIVHIAPGCGDVDHKMGQELGLPVIAPLREDGTFKEGFGDFTGREAIHPDTAELVFEKLKASGKLVAVEVYPHIYPHCWRTGDELVFRLVDEWFINMDWREEIKDVTRQIRWLPDAIDGQDRECEWLSNMSDWMISKKRFWGLALPIWVNEEDPTDFDVMGSLAELKERAVDGWDEFEGHSPHRPWIDGVVIESRQNPGQRMRRIQDVGNPWLDAGIVPFSTMHYNHDHAEWQKWYPADLVTECFPGQFRNWFYSMLSLSTMMRYDETDQAIEKRPFKTLLGHRLVQDEHGNAMHKTDGTAIWFEEAAEQLGVDTIRWMYLVQNPSADLRFGLRHPEDQVTLNTPEGEIAETKEGVPTCRVSSTPADAVRRRVLIPLWNSYAFFVNYARLDDFDATPVLEHVGRALLPVEVTAGNATGKSAHTTTPILGYIPVSDRPEIDRWILSNLQSVLVTAQEELPNYNAAAFCTAVESFLDDLTNCYIRRNRRRFWRSKDASDTDKTAAYQTLYEVLVTLCKALAPCIPFLTERMYQNLVIGPISDPNDDIPESIHLNDYPRPDESLLDHTLNARTAIAQVVVKLGHKQREDANLRVRLPLAELRVACTDAAQREAVEHLSEVIREELNIKQLTVVDNLDGLVSYTYKPNLKTLGPKYGKLLGGIRNAFQNDPPETFAPLRSGDSITLTIKDTSVDLTPDDVLIATEQSTEWSCADSEGLQIALSTVTTPELEREGMARDIIRHIQQLRKDEGLEIQDRITVQIASDSEDVALAITDWLDYIKNETLADAVVTSSSTLADTTVTVGTEKVSVLIAKQSR
ncbi:MAG: class I tRNA ligase family protein [Planctomycetota bacterium]|nr:class I tRNA ligase family protein [Planctomycetota bacterium]